MLIALLAVTLICLGALSLAIGPAALSWGETLAALVGGGSEFARIVVIEIRLPRALLAACVGAALACNGAVLQGFIRNPLASPALLGTSNAAAFGAVVVLASGAGGALSAAMPIGAVAMALVSVVLLLSITRRSQEMLTLILAGLALSALFGALTSLVLNLTKDPFSALEIAFWLLGSLADRSFDHVFLGLPFMALGVGLCAWCARSLSALTLGQETAISLGVNYGRLKLMVIVATALATGGAVAVAGAIGFVGLMVPHLIRPLVGYRPDRLLAPSALAGATLLIAADCAVRLIPSTNELKLGVVTALIGVPFFLWLVYKTRVGTAFGA
jgi:iron complex transport system permease protein